MASRAKAVAEALTWERTRFHHMGRVKGAGVDCAQLLVEVYSSVGMIPRVDVGYYPIDWHLHQSAERFVGWVKEFGHQVHKPQPGDVLLFKYGRVVSHGAILVGDGIVLHALNGIGVTRNRLTDAEFVKKDGASRFDSAWSLWDDDLP